MSEGDTVCEKCGGETVADGVCKNCGAKTGIVETVKEALGLTE